MYEQLKLGNVNTNNRQQFIVFSLQKVYANRFFHVYEGARIILVYVNRFYVIRFKLYMVRHFLDYPVNCYDILEEPICFTRGTPKVLRVV